MNKMTEIPTGFDAVFFDKHPDLPPLDEVLAELNEAVSTGQITFAEAEEALEDYGQEE